MDFNALLALMVQKNSFHLFITAGRAPTMKIEGALVEVSKTTLTKEQTLALVLSLMEARHKEEFYKTKECQFAIGVPKVGRFRVSAFIQRDAAGMVLHRIQHEIPDIDTLNLPSIVKELIMERQGLVLFAGPLGAGKSTSMASLIKYRNQNSSGHIIVLEDPMEFMHSHANCIVTQREVGLDTDSYEIALKNALQQSPDVVAIGEIRSREAMQTAMSVVDSGCLCLSTINASCAEQVMERVLNLFPDDMQRRMRMELVSGLRAIVSQQLLRSSNGKNYVISEVLINTPEVQDALRRGEFHRLKEMIINGRDVGMQSFDQALCDLFVQQKISYEDAVNSAEHKNEFRFMVKQTMQKMNLTESQDDGVVIAHSTPEKYGAEIKRSVGIFESKEITLSDVHDDDTDMGSIFTHR